MKLNAMSMDELMALREEVDTLIQSRAEEQYAELAEKMEKLAPLVKGRSTGRSKPRGKVPAKFKDPKTGKPWSGRGQLPVWLREYEAQGKKREQFAI